MITMKASNIICMLTDQLLAGRRGVQPTPSMYREEKGLAAVAESLFGRGERSLYGVGFCLDVRADYYGENGDAGHAYRRVFILACGNVSTFVAIDEDDERWYGLTEVPLDKWKNTSNHDSCWRSDGIDSPLSALYFKLAEEVNAQLSEPVAPKDITIEVAPVFTRLGTEVVVTLETDREKDPNSNYWKKVVGVLPAMPARRD